MEYGDSGTVISNEVRMALDSLTDHNEVCNYTGYFANLSFYEQDDFSFNMDYKRLNITLSLYDSINKILFYKTNVLDFAEKIYVMSRTGEFDFSAIIEMQLVWFMFLGILLLVLLILILSMAVSLVDMIFSAGTTKQCYQKIDPSNSVIRNFLGGLMSVGAIIVLLSTLLGLLGNMQYKTIKSDWEDFADEAGAYLKKYIRNVTADMGTISTVEMTYMEDRIETLLYEYHGLAATQVKATEMSHAKDYKLTAEEMDQSIAGLLAHVEKIEELLEESWALADDVSEDVTKCYEAVKNYCHIPILSIFAINTHNCDNMEPYKLIAENVLPLDQETYQLSTYKEGSLSAVADEIAKLVGLGISDFTMNNWQLWSTTVEDIMEYTDPTRVHLHDNFEGLRGWYARSLKNADRILKQFEYDLDKMMPRVSDDYKENSRFSQVVNIEAFGISVLFSVSAGFAVFCCALCMLGACTSDDRTGALPTERSNASNFVAKGMEISLGIMFLLTIATLIVALVHYVPSTMLSRSCYEVNVLGENPFRMWDANIIQPHSIISTAMGDTTSNVTFKGLLDDCKEGKSLYDALNLTNVWNLDKYFNIFDFLPYKRALSDSELNDHEHWYITYYSEDQLTKVYTALDIVVNGSTLNRMTDILVTISDRGLVKLPTKEFGNFSEAAATAGETYNDDDNKIKRALSTSCNLTLLRDTHDTIKSNFEEVSYMIINTLALGRSNYETQLTNLVEWNEPIFKKSAQVFKSKMMECVSLMDDEVRCFGQIARHQYSKIIGRCRPLYNIYEAVKNFVCERTANAAGLLMLACLINCIVLTLFSVSIKCIIPHFKRMTKLHPDDQLKLDRMKAAKQTPLDETEIK